MKQKNQDELQDMDKMTDREIQRVENKLQNKIFKIKEEKEKRQRHKKMNDSASKNSSGMITAKN